MNDTTPPYFTNFISNDAEIRVQRYEFRNKRNVIPIPKRNYLKWNARYQLFQLIHEFDEQLLVNSERLNIKLYVLEIKKYFINKYIPNCDVINCYVCNIAK